MKPSIFFALLYFFILPALAQKQSFTKTPAIGVHAAFFDFRGADSLKAFGKNTRPGLAIHFQNNITRNLDYTITAAGSFLEFLNKKNSSLSNGEKKLLLEADLSLRVKLTAPEKRINPYLQGGVGASVYNNYVGMFIPAGLGCQVNFTRELFLLINTQYRIPVTNTQHRHFYHSIGLAGAITKRKITKAAPARPPLASTSKQLDTDGDGILDSTDKCPAVPGMIKYEGCPPPDRDGDGVSDEEDECPDVKGERLRKGCPPPDKDGDGITDVDDKCPDQPGGQSGCPEVPTALKASIDSAAQQVFFETGSYAISKRSFPALLKVKAIMQTDPLLQLSIEGHTDNTGTAEKNQQLSNDRAMTVMKFLVEAGIAAHRLKAQGFGQEKPMADNATVKGRAMNRRVVFSISY